MKLILQPESYSSVGLRPLIQGVMDKTTLCSMSTVNEDGTAHVNTAFYCVDSEWRIFFVSKEDTQHIKNIEERSSMAVAIFQSDQTWDDWKIGLQLFGTCTVLDRRDGSLAARLYKERFPAYAKWLHALGRGIRYSGAPPFFMFIPETITVLHEEELGEETFVTINLKRT